MGSRRMVSVQMAEYLLHVPSELTEQLLLTAYGRTEHIHFEGWPQNYDEYIHVDFFKLTFCFEINVEAHVLIRNNRQQSRVSITEFSPVAILTKPK